MDERLYVKHARKQMNQVGLILLAYYGIMNIMAMIMIVVDMIIYLVGLLIQSAPLDMDAFMNVAMESATTNGWGYMLSILTGTIIVLLWKGKAFWRNEIFAKERKMTVASFFQLLCVFLSAQFFSQLFSLALEAILNALGFTAMAAMELASTTGGSVSMYLYACILGPIAEELLFRGLLLRLVKPWGKQTAIIVSALVFGLFHGNVIQIPFAFAVGLVLGYVALEHSIFWAMILHIINNMVLADLLNRLVEILPETAGMLVSNGVIALAAAAAVVVLIVKHREAGQYLRENKFHPIALKGMVTSPGLLVFTVLMLLMSLLTITRL